VNDGIHAFKILRAWRRSSRDCADEVPVRAQVLGYASSDKPRESGDADVHATSLM
jgi:hypothetical protein